MTPVAVRRLLPLALAVVVCLMTVGTTLPFAQGAPPPPPPPPPPTSMPRADTSFLIIGAGTASVGGRVMTDEPQPQPLRKVTLRLSGTEPNGGRMIVSGDDGSFMFSGLAAGRYMVTATRAGFITTAYGAKRPEGPGSAVTVVEAQHATIVVPMLRGAVITGTVRSPNGEPLPDQMVSVMRYRFNQNGERTLQSVRGGFGTITDDRGTYRAFGLPPGDYLVVTAGIGINATDAHRITAADVAWATQAIQDASRGNAAPATAPAATSPNVLYSPVFYPGTPFETSATHITLRAGEERSGVDMPMTLVPAAAIRGSITADGALPSNLQVTLLAHERIEGLPFSGFFTAPTLDNGQFTFTGVTPGTYTVAVRPRAGLPPNARPDTIPTTAAMIALYGTADVAMNGQDQTVTVALRPGVTVDGRTVFDGTLAPPADLTRVRVSLSAVIQGNGVAIGVPAAIPTAAGNFSFAGVTPGRYRLTSSVPGATTSGWQLRSATLDGHDVLDLPFTVDTNDLHNITLTFIDHPAELSGTIQDAAGHPTPEYFVILFSANRDYWMPQARRIQQKRPSSDGHFTFNNVPPGDYLLAAVTDVEQGEWYDPAFLNTVSQAAIPVTVQEAEKKVQDIRLRQ